MNNETTTQEISSETYKGYQISITNFNKGRNPYYIRCISLRSLTLKAKYRRFINAGQYEFTHNLEQAEAYVATIKANIDAKANAKQQKLDANAKARSEFVNPYKVGDILYGSWGYDQTNIDFFQIVEVGNRSLKIRKIASSSVRDTSWCSAEVAPIKDCFVKDETYRVNLVIRSYDGKTSHSIKSPVYGWLSKHEGGTHHSSWGH
jgi:hypothetical protein